MNVDGSMKMGSWESIGETQKPAPEDVLKYMSCRCKSCVPGKCPFVDNKLSCTDACHRKECANFIFDQNDDEDEDLHDEK